MNEVEAQPSGASVERTLDVVSHILTDADFAAEVVKHNGWVEALDQKDVAVLFLASRFQWAVDLLAVRDATLKREVDGLATQLASLEDRLGR
jgi:hypothetical protein